jgi:hypothetical protein
MCDPARQILLALYARGANFDLPTIEFPAPIPAAQVGLGLAPQDRVVHQLVVQGVVVPVAGVAFAGIVLTGRDMDGRQLPKWLIAHDDDGMRRSAALVVEMTEMAVRRAADERRAAKGKRRG